MSFLICYFMYKKDPWAKCSFQNSDLKFQNMYLTIKMNEQRILVQYLLTIQWLKWESEHVQQLKIRNVLFSK
jgi:hypothetical protein